MAFKSMCKSLFPGEFSKLITRIESAYNDSDIREKKIKAIEILKDFQKMKESKSDCKNNSTEKKLIVINDLIDVLNYEIKIHENITKNSSYKIIGPIDIELQNKLEKLNSFNISINSVDRGEKLLRRKIKQLRDKIKEKVQVDDLKENLYAKAKQQERNNAKESNLSKALKTLRRGGKRRINKTQKIRV